MGHLHGWRTCPRCGAPLEHGHERATCAACGSVFYANAAPTAGALVEDEQGRVMLARRAHDPFAGMWDIPGGFLGEDEHPLDAVVRELREETGLEIEPGAFLGCWLDVYGEGGEAARTTLNLYWLARATGGEAHPADDVAELAWFAPDELPPPEELAFTQVADVLSAWRRRRAKAGSSEELGDQSVPSDS
jgi:ADP-ribose pyrophosphatase YjhB (NUDIX family)